MINMKRIVLFLLLDLLMVSCYTEDQEVDYDYVNGQTMTFVPSLPSNVISVDYYWDEILIDTKTEMPFVLVFKIEGQSSGTHTLKYNTHYSSSSGGSSYVSEKSTSKSIRIK